MSKLYIVTCLFNFYAEYIMRNAGLEEAQAGIKIAWKNISNLRYADDTTLMAKSEEELKSLLMKVKKKNWLKIQHSENEDHGILSHQFSSVQFSSVQSISHLRIFVTPWIASRQASLSIRNSQNLFKLMSIYLFIKKNWGLQNHYRW